MIFLKQTANSFYKKGSMLVEVLVVLAIVVMILGIVLPSFKTMKESSVVKSGAQDILSALDKARSKTLASVNSSEYGVHFEANKIVVFRGVSYFQNDANNEIIDIVPPSAISNVTLGGVSGVSGDIYFSRLSGAPSKTGTITIGISSLFKNVTISATGLASVN